MAKKYTSFPCATCGWGGYEPCVIGKKGSATWLKQIPLKQWHAARRNELKKLKAEAKEQKSHGE